MGTYRLVSVESTSADGEVQRPFGEDPDGFMTFTPEGYMLALLARHDRPTFADGDIMGGTDQERAAAFRAPARSPAATRYGTAGW